MKTINNLKAATIAVTLALGAITFNAMAEESFNAEVQTNQQPLVGVFTKLDVSADGLLTRKEAAKDKLFSRKHFNKADLDHDFTLDQEEYSNYKSAAQTHKTQHAISDSVITTKAKAEILATKHLKSRQISVETHNGDVILSGFVDDEEAKAKAEEVVSKIEGVKSVKNSLVVRT